MEKFDKQVVLFSTTNEKTTYKQLLQSEKEKIIRFSRLASRLIVH